MKRQFPIAMFVFLVGFSACQKDLSSDGFVMYSGNAMNDTVWTRTIPATAAVFAIPDSTRTQLFIDSLNVERNDTLRFNNGIQLSVPANSLTNNTGGSVAGKVRIELSISQTRGDLLRNLKSTITDETKVLDLSAVIFLRASQQNQELYLRPNATCKIRFADTAELKSNQLVFSGIETNLQQPVADTAFAWGRSGEHGLVTNWTTTGLNTARGYEVTLKKLRWVAIGKYADSSSPRNKLSIILPPNYTNRNTAVFAVIGSGRSVMPLRADYSSRTFAFVNVPSTVGLTVITVSRINNNFYLGSKTVGSTQGSNILKIEPEKKTTTAIIQYLSNL